MPNSEFLVAQLAYEKVSSVDINSLIDQLDNALIAYARNETVENKNLVIGKVEPISTYYSTLADAISLLEKYIKKASKNISDSNPRLLNEERYSNKVNPEESMEARESSFSLVPELRISSLPYLIALSVFMASFSILLIFNMSGFSGQLGIPPSIIQWINPPASPVPIYYNPIILATAGISVIGLVIAFGVLYYKDRR